VAEGNIDWWTKGRNVTVRNEVGKGSGNTDETRK
jgi:membrane-bound inhibitor of C-type lysozyme